MIGQFSINHGARNIIFDVNIPYTYIPDADFAMVETILSQKYSKEEFSCSYSQQQVCKFHTNCANISDKELNLTIKLNNENGELEKLNILSKELFIPGTEIGDEVDTCIIPLFKHNIPYKADTYILGNVFFKAYYVVFDMTPYDEGKLPYLQIGVAPRNPLDVIGYKQYAPKSIFYDKSTLA